MRRAFFVLAAAFLSACNHTGALEAVRFDPAEAAFINNKGNATIEGHAFLRDEHGQVNVRYAAGEIVWLVPATAYSQARFSYYYGGAKFAPARFTPRLEADPEYYAYTRSTKTESVGRFVFDNVAPGRYFVTTQLTWRPKDSLFSEGGAMYDEVTVTGKETGPIKVVLSGN